jgi:very-short-patch-repair endonuclease
MADKGFTNDSIPALSVVESPIEGRASIGVELDGKAFHASDSQISADRKRDRLALLNGLPIIRYSGSEVFSSAASVVNEAMNIAASFRSKYHGEPK